MYGQGPNRENSLFYAWGRGRERGTAEKAVAKCMHPSPSSVETGEPQVLTRHTTPHPSIDRGEPPTLRKNVHKRLRDRPVIYLTAGAGGMYCGSCLRDNALVRHLRQAGVDAQLVPLYTPIRTDETDVSGDRLFFGGINIYCRHRWPWFAALPMWLTGWLDAPWLLRRVAARSVETDAARLGRLTMAMLAGSSGPLKAHVGQLVKWLERERPALVNLSNLLIAGAVPQVKERLGVPVVVTLQGDDLFLDQLESDYRRPVLERLQDLARYVDRFVVFSRFYQHKMARMLDVAPERFENIPLGIDVADWRELNRNPRPQRPPTIGFLARAAPEKGLHVLIEAFIHMKTGSGIDGSSSEEREAARRCRLIVAGWNSGTGGSYAGEQRRRLEEAGCADHVQWWGEVDRPRKQAFFEAIDLLCVPMPYEEPKGLFVLEALACGVPVIVPAHGIFPEMLGELEGGWLLKSVEPRVVAEELSRRVVDLPGLRNRGAIGRERVLEKRTAQVMASATLDVYDRVLS